MVENFENHTKELTQEELRLLPMFIKGFKNYGSTNPIKASDVVTLINSYLSKNKIDITVTQPKLRKIANHIRTNGLLPLIATSKGYFVSRDAEVIKSQIRSLEQRANSIQRCADGLKKYVNQK